MTLRHGDRSRPLVALTFDDAPDPGVTPSILETLRTEDTRATFFCIGERVECHPGLVRQMTGDGHQLGNHTHTHADLTTLEPGEIRDQVRRAGDAVARAAGIRPRLFRPPFGHFRDREAGLIRSLGLVPVLWDVDPRDFEAATGEEVRRSVAGGVRPGSVVLFHADRHVTAACLADIIRDLRGMSLRPVSLNALLGHDAAFGSRKGRDVDG